MNLTVQDGGASGASGTRQGCDRDPAVPIDFVSIRIGKGVPVWAFAAAQRVEAPGIGRYGNVVPRTRQRGGAEPAIVLGIVDVMFGMHDPAADDVQASAPFGAA